MINVRTDTSTGHSLYFEMLHNSRFKVWTVGCGGDRVLFLEHNKYHVQFKLTFNHASIAIEMIKNDGRNDAKGEGALLGMLARHYRPNIREVSFDWSNSPLAPKKRSSKKKAAKRRR